MNFRTASLALSATLSIGALLAFGVDPGRAAVPSINTDCSGGYIAFTFDDGPGANTPALLQTLNDLNLKATFFVLGDKVDASATNRQIISDELAGGFSVQNHTYDHASFTGASTGTTPLTEAQITSELEDASTAIVNVGGPKPTLYRPPYGDINAYDDLIARNLGFRIVMPWGSPTANVVDSQDWTGISSAAITANVTQGYTKNGYFYPGIKADSIVSMHDGEDQTTLNTIQALPSIVDYMNAKHLCSTAQIRTDATGGMVPPPAPPEPTTGNLLQNPSLETLRPTSSQTSEPACFQLAGANVTANAALWSLTSDAHSGAVAERVDVTNWTGGDRKLVTTQRASEQSCLGAVTPGRTYSMWAWYKGSWPVIGSSLTRVSIATYYRNAAGSWIYWQSSPLLAPTSAWNLASFTSAPLPAGATAISFGVAIAGPGTLTTDDYALAAN
jgi:peptidoglycan/xylan/chitin deacetylase (PgdA/CDA1 family)